MAIPFLRLSNRFDSTFCETYYDRAIRGPVSQGVSISCRASGEVSLPSHNLPT